MFLIKKNVCYKIKQINAVSVASALLHALHNYNDNSFFNFYI